MLRTNEFQPEKFRRASEQKAFRKYKTKVQMSMRRYKTVTAFQQESKGYRAS